MKVCYFELSNSHVISFLNSTTSYLDDYGYNIMADIRKNAKGIENLYHGGHKYYKYGDQNWRCTKMSKCKAKVRTAVINGVTMMKFLEPEHSHTI